MYIKKCCTRPDSSTEYASARTCARFRAANASSPARPCPSPDSASLTVAFDGLSRPSIWAYNACSALYAGFGVLSTWTIPKWFSLFHNGLGASTCRSRSIKYTAMSTPRAKS